MTNELTTQQFAAQVGLSLSTITNWLRSGKLKGAKKSGKWMISAEQLSQVTLAAGNHQISGNHAEDSSSQTVPQPCCSYSVDQFADMTFLTIKGVQRYLNEGRLTGEKDSDGHWRILESNLTRPEIKRLVRK